jgi:MtN3 and saliva related transmembrane protein
MDMVMILGIFAGIFTTTAFLPQVIKAHTTKHTKDLSLGMYALFTTGIVLWLIYGILIMQVPIILANIVSLGLSLYLLLLKMRYG